MNLRKFLLMSIFLVLGVLYLSRSEREKEASTGDTGPVTVFSGITKDAITKISGVQANESYSVVRRSDGLWELRRPEGALANREKVEQFLRAVPVLRAPSVIDAAGVEDDKSVYGLAPPELILTVEGDFGKRVLSFGKKVAVSGRRYAQLEGDPRIFLVNDEAFTLFHAAADEVRDHLPIKFDPAKVSTMVVARGGDDNLKFTRGKGWDLEAKGTKFAADKEFVDSKLQELLRAKAKRFVDEPGPSLGVYGLANPKLVVQLRMGGEEADTSGDLTLQIGEGVSVDASASDNTLLEAGRGYYLRISGKPFVYEMQRPFYSDLLQPADYFRTRTPLGFLVGKPIEKVEGEVDGTKITLAYGNGQWARGDGHVVETAKVQAFLSALAQQRIVTYPLSGDDSIESAGLDHPSLGVKVFIKDKPEPVVFHLGDTVKPAKGGEPDNDAPNWVRVSQEDGTVLPAIAEGASARKLKQDLEYFGKIS